MQERSQRERHHFLRHRNPGANSSPDSKRDVIEVVVTVVIQLPVIVSDKKPLGLELQRVFPNARVSMDSPSVYEDCCFLRDCETA